MISEKKIEKKVENSAEILQEIPAEKIAEFQRVVLDFYEKNARALPRRETENPREIFVSEFMLQQTQVSRVIPKFLAFVEKFPAPEDAASASFEEIFSVWQGLGFNRRAKFLWEAASEIVEKFGGKIPKKYEELRSLPGVGDYTARGAGVRVERGNPGD